MATARLPGLPLPSRTISRQKGSRPPVHRRSSKATSHPMMRTLSGCSKLQVRRLSARPTWTSSAWAPPPRTLRSAPPSTPATPPAFPVDPPGAVPLLSLPAWSGWHSVPIPAGPSAALPHSAGSSGLKPSYGRVSRYGLIAYSNSLEQIGPLGKTVSDVSTLMGVIAGYDRHDSTSQNKPYNHTPEADIKGLKIGIPQEYFGKGVDPAGCR